MRKNETILGIGTDIISIDRFRASVQKHGEAFLQKLFLKEEIAYCNKHADPIPSFAARFSAKEAVVKALGEGFGESLAFHDVEITKDSKGKPDVSLSTKASDRFGAPSFHLSVSHCKEFATATAIALKQGK